MVVEASTELSTLCIPSASLIVVVVVPFGPSLRSIRVDLPRLRPRRGNASLPLHGAQAGRLGLRGGGAEEARGAAGGVETRRAGSRRRRHRVCVDESRAREQRRDDWETQGARGVASWKRGCGGLRRPRYWVVCVEVCYWHRADGLSQELRTLGLEEAAAEGTAIKGPSTGLSCPVPDGLVAPVRASGERRMQSVGGAAEGRELFDSSRAVRACVRPRFGPSPFVTMLSPRRLGLDHLVCRNKALR